MCIYLEKKVDLVFCSVVNPKREIVACLAWMEPQPKSSQDASQAPLIAVTRSFWKQTT